MEEIDLEMGTPVKVDFANIDIRGIVVGKITINGVLAYIVKCTDGYLPRKGYEYDTFVTIGEFGEGIEWIR
jgi:hypothetical protein